MNSAGIQRLAPRLGFVAPHQRGAKPEGPIDVLVCDLMMPRIDGLELARRMRFAYPNTKIILMSAYHLTRAQLERAQVGEIRFLPKPYEFRQLEAHLAACLGTPVVSEPVAVAL